MARAGYLHRWDAAVNPALAGVSLDAKKHRLKSQGYTEASDIWTGQSKKWYGESNDDRR